MSRWPVFDGTEKRGGPLIALATAASLVSSIAMFSPRLWLMRHDMPGTFQWDRAHTFLLQCAAPLRRDIEPAMLWRLLPPAICHALGLRGYAPLAVPWLGVIAATAYVAALHRRRCADPRFVLGGALIFATTSAVLVPVGWLGMNDAWAWLGLLVFAFGRSSWTRAAACLLCPWVDERFLIGLPLAAAVRWADSGSRFRWKDLAAFFWVAPYAILRLGYSFDSAVAQPTHAFLIGTLRETGLLVPWAPLAWWMGLRAAWLPVAFAMRRKPLEEAGISIKSWLQPVILGGGALMTLVVCLVLAADMSRSAAVLVPLAVLGGFRFLREYPALAPRVALAVGIANLLLPAAHVSFTKFDPINPLVIEVLRLRHT